MSSGMGETGIIDNIVSFRSDESPDVSVNLLAPSKIF